MKQVAPQEPIADLIARAHAGDKRALDRLVGQVGSRLRDRARRQLPRKLRARLDPSDVVQVALLEGARDFADFAGTTFGEFLSWMEGILDRNVLDDVKANVSQKRNVEVERSLDAPSPPGRGRGVLGVPASDLTSPSQKVARRQQVTLILGFMDELAVDQRRALDLWLAGQSMREIGARLSKTEQAAASLLKRALQHVRARADAVLK